MIDLFLNSIFKLWKLIISFSTDFGRKALCKGKGLKSKRYRWHDDELKDGPSWDAGDDWNDDNETSLDAGNVISEEMPLTCRLGDALDCYRKKKSDKKSGRKRRWEKSDESTNNIFSSNQASSTPVKIHGKGATIYEEQVDTNTDNDITSADNTVPENASVTVAMAPEQDTRFSQVLNISTHSISPCNLKETYSSAYTEGVCQPRRFAIDIARHRGANSDVYALFEMVEDENNNRHEGYRWHDVAGEWQNLDVNQYCSIR